MHSDGSCDSSLEIFFVHSARRLEPGSGTHTHYHCGATLGFAPYARLKEAVLCIWFSCATVFACCACSPYLEAHRVFEVEGRAGS